MATNTPFDPRRSPEPSRDEVADLIRSIEENEVARSGRAPLRSKKGVSPVWYAVLLLAIVGNAYLWLARPAWVFGGSEAGAGTVDVEGRLRYQVYMQAARIEAYRRAQGQLPGTQDELGGVPEGIRYVRTGPESWELTGESGDVRVTYRSSDAMEDFLQGT